MVALKKYRTYLKDFMEKQKDYEVWINKDMHNNYWLNEFHETEVSERKINILMVMCQYLYAIPGHNANIERKSNLLK